MGGRKEGEYQTIEAWDFTIYDHRRTWLAYLKSSFDGLGFHIPHAALMDYEEDLGGKHSSPALQQHLLK